MIIINNNRIQWFVSILVIFNSGLISYTVKTHYNFHSLFLTLFLSHKNFVFFVLLCKLHLLTHNLKYLPDTILLQRELSRFQLSNEHKLSIIWIFIIQYLTSYLLTSFFSIYAALPPFFTKSDGSISKIG